MNSSSADAISARKLRQNGNSFRDIAKTLRISLSTAHLWTKDILLSTEQARLLAERQQKAFQYGRKIASTYKRQKKDKDEMLIVAEARAEFDRHCEEPFFILGLSLYWAEGFKKDHSLGFVNSDSEMSLIFLKWLFLYGKVSLEDIRARIQINEIYQDSMDPIVEFWSSKLHIPVSQFQKPFFQKSKSITKHDPKYRGQVRIRAVKTRALFLRILTWIEELKVNYTEN